MKRDVAEIVFLRQVSLLKVVMVSQGFENQINKL